MAFITNSDYKVIIGEASLKVIEQAGEDNITLAQQEAQEEISSYLRPTYDCDVIFRQTGSDRNKLLVMYMCDISLYHLMASLPQRMGMEVRKERYERAVKWLEGVQSGKIVPELPTATDSEGNITGGKFIINSQKQQRYNW